MRAVPALPIFEGLDPTTAARLVAAFSWRTYERGDRIGWAERADARTVVMVFGAARLVRMGVEMADLRRGRSHRVMARLVRIGLVRK